MNCRSTYRASCRSVLLALGLTLLLAACASKQSAPVIDRSPAPAPTAKPSTSTPASAPASAQAAGSTDFYTVKRGDTLFGIALDHGQDYREIAAWNNIANPNLIQVGQVLRVTPPPGTVGAAESGVIVRPISPSGAQVATPPGANSGLVTEPAGAKRPYTDEALAQAQGKPVPPAAKPADKPADKPLEKPAAPATEGEEVAWGWPMNGRIIGQFSESGTNKGIDIAAKVGDAVNAAGPGRVVYAGQGLRGYGRLVIIKHNNTYLSAYAHNSNILVKEGQTVTRGQKIAEAGNTDSDVPKLHFEIRRQGKPVDPIKLLPER